MGLIDPVKRRAYLKEWHRKWSIAHGGIGYNTQWARDHPVETIDRHAKHALRNKTDPKRRAIYRARFTLKRRELKLEVFNAYGGPICACCAEAEIEFLTLDHVNDDGRTHRLITGAGMTFYYWLKRHGFPQVPALQVFCMNCNLGKRINGGVCPHKKVF